MTNDRVEGSVKDIKSLTKEQINDYLKNTEIITTDITIRRGKASIVETNLGSMNGRTYRLLSKVEVLRKISSIEEKIHKLCLNSNVEGELVKREKTGEINSRHISEIRKAINLSFAQTPAECQEDAIDTIINNIQQREDVNKEEVSLACIKAGLAGQMDAEAWFSSVMRLSDLLIDRLLQVDRVELLLTKIQRAMLAEKFSLLDGCLHNAESKLSNQEG